MGTDSFHALLLKYITKVTRFSCSQNIDNYSILEILGPFSINISLLKGTYRCAFKIYRYGVDQKKVSIKSEEKMHTKMKMSLQRAENLVHVQQHCGKYFYKKIFFLILLYKADMAI